MVCPIDRVGHRWIEPVAFDQSAELPPTIGNEPRFWFMVPSRPATGPFLAMTDSVQAVGTRQDRFAHLTLLVRRLLGSLPNPVNRKR